MWDRKMTNVNKVAVKCETIFDHGSVSEQEQFLVTK